MVAAPTATVINRANARAPFVDPHGLAPEHFAAMAVTLVGASGALAPGVPRPVFWSAFTVWSSRFGEPVPGLVTTPGVAVAVICATASAGESAAVAESMRVAAPATCGEAIEVPEMVVVAVVEVYHADRIDDPGANRSRQVPTLECEARASPEVVAPTVTALVTRAVE